MRGRLVNGTNTQLNLEVSPTWQDGTLLTLAGLRWGQANELQNNQHTSTYDTHGTSPCKAAIPAASASTSAHWG